MGSFSRILAHFFSTIATMLVVISVAITGCTHKKQVWSIDETNFTPAITQNDDVIDCFGLMCGCFCVSENMDK